MQRIGIDMMGGDYGITATVVGAWLAYNDTENIKLVLFGDEDYITKEMKRVSYTIDRSVFEYVDCRKNVDTGDDPYYALKELQDSSIMKGLEYLSKGKIDVFCTAGNTGATFLGAIKHIGAIEGISRPALISLIPKGNNKFGILLDVGANANCKPENLLDFAKLGFEYAKKIGIENPRVGLLNIGSEKGKGNTLVKESFDLLEDTPNFIGNIEGGDLLGDKADVYVCDGFTGNILLKFCESLVTKGLPRFDSEQYGGMPILGLNKPVIIGHGKSSTVAIKNMIETAIKNI